MQTWRQLIAQAQPNNTDWISPLIQLPFLALFVIYTLRIMKDNRDDMKARDAAWMEFLDAEREQRIASIKAFSELATAITKQAEGVMELAKAVHQHDQHAMERYAGFERLLKGRAKMEGDGA